MTGAAPKPKSFEERIAAVRLWTLPLVLVLVVCPWALASKLLGVPLGWSPASAKLVLYLIMFGWWFVNVSPRPASVRATMGRRLDLRGWKQVALAFVGVTCVRLVWWIARDTQLVQAALTGGSFTYSDQGAAPEPRVFVVAVVLAPIVEELVCRGTLFRKWRARWGRVPALLLSSLVFGFLHAEGLASSLTGLTYALLYTATGSLWASVTMHAVNNGALFGVAIASYLWPTHKAIRLDRTWEFVTLALVLLAGVAAWLRFVLRSWKTLGNALPPDSLQGPPVATLAHTPQPALAARGVPGQLADDTAPGSSAGAAPAR